MKTGRSFTLFLLSSLLACIVRLDRIDVNQPIVSASFDSVRIELIIQPPWAGPGADGTALGLNDAHACLPPDYPFLLKLASARVCRILETCQPEIVQVDRNIIILHKKQISHKSPADAPAA